MSRYVKAVTAERFLLGILPAGLVSVLAIASHPSTLAASRSGDSILGPSGLIIVPSASVRNHWVIATGYAIRTPTPPPSANAFYSNRSMVLVEVTRLGQALPRVVASTYAYSEIIDRGRATIRPDLAVASHIPFVDSDRYYGPTPM
jgi:hypothetical protein